MQRLAAIRRLVIVRCRFLAAMSKGAGTECDEMAHDGGVALRTVDRVPEN